MADGKSYAKLLLPVMGVFLLVCPVIHSSEDKRQDTGRNTVVGRLPRKILEDIKKIKCPSRDINSLNPNTVLLAKLLDNSSDSNSNHTEQQFERLVFPIDSSVLDFNISALGWRFRLWNIRDTPQPSNQAVLCLDQVVESGPYTIFEFQELHEEREIKSHRSEESEQRQRPGSDGGCREFTSDTCIERIDLGGGHGEDDGDNDGDDVGDDEASILRSAKRCSGSLNISSPDTGLRYLELFREPGARTAEVTVEGQSYLHFHFNFSIPITALPVLDQPIAGDMYIIELTFSCRDLVDFAQSRLLTLSESGQMLDDGVALQEGVNVITIPHQNFYISVEEELHPKQNLDVRIRLRNQDKADTFSVTASFSAYTDYLTAKISPKVLSVKEGGYKEIHIVVSVHESISQKIISLLTIEVKRQSDASLTLLTRDVTATPDSFGEDAEPPSCSTIYQSSQCDPKAAATNCSARTWEAGVLVDDMSGVYRAFFSTPLMSSIAYLQAHGKLMAEALVRRDCCSPNATLLVEDYMGNSQTCTLEAPTFNMNPHKTQRQPVTSDVKSVVKSATDTKIKFLKENTTQLPKEKNVTANTEARRNKYNKDEGGLWTPKLLTKIKTLAIIIACLLCLVLCYWIIKVALNKELKAGKAKGNSHSPAFHFRKRLSRHTSQKGQTRSENVQMARPGKSLVSALPMSLIEKPNVFRVMQATRINKAFCQENISEGPVSETSSQNVNPNRSGGGVSGAEDASNDSTSHASLADSRCDEAYSSLRSSMKSTNLQKETSMSQMSISDLEPRNKTEMYERILQCRDLLEQLERKRAGLMNSADLKHHTVPRIRQHVVKTEPYWAIDKTPGNPCQFVHGKRKETGNKRSESFGEQREADDQVSTDWTKDSTLEDDTKQAISSPVSPAKRTKNINSSWKGKHQTDIEIINLSAGREKATSDVKMQEKVDRVAGEIRNAATTPELSQGHVSNLIEGATQISLRHEIQRLRERLLEYSKVVEDEIHFKRDLCERLSLAGEQVDSDFEEI